MLLTPMVYAQTVTIGAQVWTAKNLNVTKFRNGEAIPQAKTNEEWKAAGDNKQAAWCYYNNDSANVAKYGILYNWYAVNDPRGLAPAGYHIPSDAEWTTLSTFLGGEYAAGSKMKSTSGWEKNGNGNNSSGFSGLPGGTRVSGGTFDTIGINGNWWSSSEFDTYYSWTRFLSYPSGLVLRNRSTKTNGFSVRCLRD
jgi:uncharacterized protein (TIGR02145 family)